MLEDVVVMPIMNPLNQRMQFLFVCGCPRSGTSAVAAWLLSSDHIAIGMERYQKYWSNHFRLPENAFEENRFFDINPGDTWYDTLERFPEHYNNIRDKWPRAVLFGDKIPALWKNLPGVFSSLPSAKVIFTYRDPFSVARSYKSRSLNPDDDYWGKHRGAAFAIQEWNESAAKIAEFFNSYTFPYERCHILKYEDFSSNCIDFRGLGAFLGSDVALPAMYPGVGTAPSSKQDQLTDVEKELIWTFLDNRSLNEVRRIIDYQKRHFSMQKAAPGNNSVRDTYHAADKRDADIDYGEFRIPGCNYIFRRAPDALNLQKSYAACIGSATTFGRFLRNPYPAQLEALSKIPFLNLGLGGARPESYLTNEPLLEILRNASLVILEVMSARGYLSPFFEPIHPAGNMGFYRDVFELSKHARNDPKLHWLISKSDKREPVFVDRVYEITFKYLTPVQRDTIRDALVSRYCSDLKSLLSEIKAPVVGLVMTRNKDNYHNRRARDPRTLDEWSGGYPHFVDEICFKFLEQNLVPVLDCRSHRGFPYIVRNWSTGEPAPVYPWQDNPALNTYYPSQEMHDDAAQALIKHPEINSALRLSNG